MTQFDLNSEPYLTVSYDDVHDWLFADWHGHVDSEDVMTGSLKILSMLRKIRCTHVLNDNTRLTGIWADAAIWGAEELLPQLHEAGCRYFAWVYSPEAYSRLSAELIVERTTAGIALNNFDDMATARKWLQQQ